MRIFDLPAVRRSFDADTIGRGSVYCDEGRVLSWQTHAEYVVGEVRGAGRAPYAVTLTAAMSKSGVWLTGRCSCPVGRNCKHAAALAFTILRHPDEPSHGDPSTSLGMTKSALGMTGDAALRQAQGDTEQPLLRLGTLAPGPMRKRCVMLPSAELIGGSQEAYDRLRRYGFVPLNYPDSQVISENRTMLELPLGEEYRWVEFVEQTADELRDLGWRVIVDTNFPYRAVELGEWSADVYDGPSTKWFELELGIDIDGERVSLLPILLDALGRAGMDLASDPTQLLTRKTPLLGKLPDGTFVALPPDRVARVLSTLASLFGDDAAHLRGARASVLLQRAGALADLDGLTTHWIDAARVRALFEDLATARTQHVDLPSTFHGVLRPYQHEGVAWLQTLRRHELGGILADDMGLGKTVQLLAHLAIEHAAGRLDKPVLVVAPTSVIPNWRAEIARFLPDLPRNAIELTSYGLLTRRIEEYTHRDWSIVVLDEAQVIKNPRTQAAAVARDLSAAQRIAMSGTPVENHLEELWSIFAFAVPGLLQNRTRFARLFRTPIERRGDDARRRALSARIAPFLLRRTKERVEQDLPEKTEVVQRIELTGAQRDLYETIRVAMQQRVLGEIGAHGLNRSRIVVLDALLKLRQVCCDPRLLSLPEALEVNESQKLEALLEMLESLIEDGRRILLFSQFTSMLDLIVPELHKRHIAFVELRGDTRDRETPVQRFQSREVPLFLISLKAGGIGLNLTAADTVIHYDPWWNPAVERQATDRAHRIGQEQHVFVYKLIAQDTVEERIVQLQERKAELAAALLEGESDRADFTLADVEQLFA